MKTSYNLSIKTPCSEKWASFTQSPTGGFCSLCTKIVVDYTKMRDDEIAEQFKNATAKMCGRFQVNQLRKVYVSSDLPRVTPGFRLFKSSVLTFLLIMLSRPIFAQNSEGQKNIENVQQVFTRGASNQIKKGHIISGVVKSAEDGTALPGVNVILKGTVNGTITDFEGHFKFPEELNMDDVLVFSFIGLELQEYKVPEKPTADIFIHMDMTMEFMMGEVAINSVYEPQKRFKSFVFKVMNLF